MKAVFADVPEHILAWRRNSDADQFDEMWQGVLHVAPSPNCAHQDFEGELEMWLRQNWAKPNGCHVYHQINVADPDAEKWTDNYRIPDLVLLTPQRFHINRNDYFAGGPDAIVEIHSPGDEAYEKLEFYAKVGVKEAWIIERDTKQPEIFESMGGQFRSRAAAADGWLRSDVVGAEMRASGGGKLEIRLVGRPETAALLP